MSDETPTEKPKRERAPSNFWVFKSVDEKKTWTVVQTKKPTRGAAKESINAEEGAYYLTVPVAEEPKKAVVSKSVVFE